MSTSQSPEFAGVNIAATALLEYDIHRRQWLALQPVFKEWVEAVIDDLDYQQDLPLEVLRRWGSGWTRRAEILDIEEYVPHAQDPAVRHAKAGISLTMKVVSARQEPTQDRVDALIDGLWRYRSEVDNAAAELAQAGEDVVAESWSIHQVAEHWSVSVSRAQAILADAGVKSGYSAERVRAIPRPGQGARTDLKRKP